MTTETLVNTLVAGKRLALDVHQEDAVVHWRFDELERAGYDEIGALAIAIDSSIDLHRACALLHDGCPAATALEILL